MRRMRTTGLMFRSGFRFLAGHPWLFGLSVLGIALGVSVVVSIDLANTSARQGFNLSAETLTGSTTHQIHASGEGVDEEVFRELRSDLGIRKSAPVIEGHGYMERAGRTFQLLGVDPLAEGPFRGYSSREAGIDLESFMAQPGTGLLSGSTAQELGLEPADTVKLRIAGRIHELVIAGLIETEDDRSRLALESMIVMDISTAQEFMDMPGKLSRIDLIIPEDEESAILNRIKAILPGDAVVEGSEARQETMQQMTRAFELNLNALSMLALLVGMFLIYSTMSFSVVQRRPLIGRLRALGATKGEVFAMILTEALIIGITGTIAGMLLGIFLANGLVQLVARTINDLYFVLTVQELTLDITTLLKGAALGIGATLIAALAPAREAANRTVSTVLQRSAQESFTYRHLLNLFFRGVLISAAGVVFLYLLHDIVFSYLSILLIILGFTLAVPLFIVLLVRLFRPLMSLMAGMIGRMAARGVVSALSRTSVSITALSVAVAATIGVGIMVDSFRTTVSVWMFEQLQADIHIHPPGGTIREATGSLDHDLVRAFREAEGVDYSHTSRHTNVMTEYGNVRMMALEQGPPDREVFRVKNGIPAIWDEYTEVPRVYVTEVFAYRNEIDVGDSLLIHTDRGDRYFPVGAVYYDYGSDIGRITMSNNVYRDYFDDGRISALLLYAEEDAEIGELMERLRAIVPADRELLIRSNRDMREASLEIFDRTFTITRVLQFLVLLVAFVGVLSSLMALQLERARELAVLRANGMTPGQLWRYVIYQTALMGTKAGLLALPLGILMAYVLVYVINLRSFGWTLQFIVSPSILIQAVLLSLIAAVIAGLYPSVKMARAKPADALRNE